MGFEFPMDNNEENTETKSVDPEEFRRRVLSAAPESKKGFPEKIDNREVDSFNQEKPKINPEMAKLLREELTGLEERQKELGDWTRGVPHETTREDVELQNQIVNRIKEIKELL